MRMPRPLSWTLAAGVTALVPLVASPANASLTGPDGAYLLMVTPVGQQSPERSATLWCGPDGGTHSAVQNACGQLRSVSGRIGDLAGQPGSCTLEYRPVRVTAAGTWRGTPRHFDRTYPNRCAAVRDTGGVLFAL